MYSCHLFLISSASVRSLPFLSFIVPIFAWNIPLLSPVFLKRSLVFHILLISPISLCCLHEVAFLSLLGWYSLELCIQLDMCVLHAKSLLSFWLFATLWTVASQAPLSMGFSKQEYWCGLLCSPPGNFPHWGIEPMSLKSPALAGKFFTSSATQYAFSLSISYHFSFAFCFSSFISYLQALLRQPLCLLAFLFLWNSFGHRLLYSLMNLCP